MKKGEIEKQDADKLMRIYEKIRCDGRLREPLEIDEQVLLYCLVVYIRKNAKE